MKISYYDSRKNKKMWETINCVAMYIVLRKHSSRFLKVKLVKNDNELL